MSNHSTTDTPEATIAIPLSSLVFPKSDSNPDRVHMIMIGNADAIDALILDLQRRAFAEAIAWSPPQRIPDSDDVICLHIHRLSPAGGSEPSE